MKLTVRFVVEQDFEVNVKNKETGLGGWLSIGDSMVMSGHDIHELSTHENIFENPISKVRPVNGMGLWDCNLYNLMQGGAWDTDTFNYWLEDNS